MQLPRVARMNKPLISEGCYSQQTVKIRYLLPSCPNTALFHNRRPNVATIYKVKPTDYNPAVFKRIHCLPARLTT